MFIALDRSVYIQPQKISSLFDLFQASTYKYTDIFEVIRLAIHAEGKAITFYSNQRESVSDPKDRSILKTLIRFEKGHKRKIERELDRLFRKYKQEEQKTKGTA